MANLQKLIYTKYFEKADLQKLVLMKINLFKVNELSMVTSDLWIDINSRLEEIFMMIPENTFDGLSIITVADFPQLIFW